MWIVTVLCCIIIVLHRLYTEDYNYGCFETLKFSTINMVIMVIIVSRLSYPSLIEVMQPDLLL